MPYLFATARPIAEDMAGTAVFYVLYLATGSAALGAAVGLALGFGQIAMHRIRRERVPALLWLGVALTVTLGGVSLALQSPRFLLLKPSIIYSVIGASMLPRGWLIRYVPEIATRLLPTRSFDRAGWGWAALMFASALLNVVLVASFSPTRAAAVFVLWAMSSKLALFGGQYWILKASAVRAYHARQGEA